MIVNQDLSSELRARATIMEKTYLRSTRFRDLLRAAADRIEKLEKTLRFRDLAHEPCCCSFMYPEPPEGNERCARCIEIDALRAELFS